MPKISQKENFEKETCKVWKYDELPFLLYFSTMSIVGFLENYWNATMAMYFRLNFILRKFISWKVARASMPIEAFINFCP